MDGAHAAVLHVGGHPQCRLQAGAGGHQPVPGRLQQPHRAHAAAGDPGGDGGDREDLPRGQEPAADPREPHAQFVLPDQRQATGAHLLQCRPERAPGLARSGHHRADRVPAPRRQLAHLRAAGAHAAPTGPEGLRSLHRAAQQRPVGRPAQDPREPQRAVPAAAAARGLGRATQDQPLPQLRRSGQEVRQAAGHGPVADQPDVLALRPGQLGRGHGAGLRADQRRRAADQDPPQAQGIRHQREAVRRGQGRQRHLRHGRDDGARCQGARGDQPAHAQQDGCRQGRPAGHRGDHPGRRAHLRARERGRRRAGGLHDRPLRGSAASTACTPSAASTRT